MNTNHNDLCYMTANEALAKFRARQLSPVELMKAVIARSEKVNSKLNAFTYTFFDQALKEAKEAESRYLKKNGRIRPLEGIPVAIKDYHPVKGEITTFGSRVFEHFRPDFTAPTVTRLLQAGCIMHARTTTPEFAYSDVCHSLLWGITRNPWNLDYSPGGSSGGAGAALAAGMTTIADGTDGGGSIRIPASACGVVGFKPPFGRNPLDIDHAMESILAYGPMARSVADIALMQNVMSGPHPQDASSIRQRLRIPPLEKLGNIKGWKVAFSMDLGYIEVDAEVQKITRNALKTFKTLGCHIEEVDVEWSWQVYNTWITYWEGLFAATAGHLLLDWRSKMDPFVVRLLERGLSHSAKRLYQCQRFRGQMYKTLGPILDKFDILVVPTTALSSVMADHNDLALDFRINGRQVPAYVGWVLTHGFNLMSYCPVMSVPSGMAECGIPTGLQFVGRTFDDIRVFRAAAAYEAANPWRQRKPKIPGV